MAKTERFALSGDKKDKKGVKKLGAKMDGHEQVVMLGKKLKRPLGICGLYGGEGNYCRRRLRSESITHVYCQFLRMRWQYMC